MAAHPFLHLTLTLMVILDYASTDHDHLAVTKEGFWEAIRFQNYFYAFNRSFSRLQDAIDSCRHEMDRGSLISIVVVRPPRFEVWSRIGSEVPVMPKQWLQGGASRPAAPSPSPRKRPFWRFWERAAEVSGVDVELPSARSLFYRGDRPYNALPS